MMCDICGRKFESEFQEFFDPAAWENLPCCDACRYFKDEVAPTKRQTLHIDAEIKFNAWVLVTAATKRGREIGDEEMDSAVERIVHYAMDEGFPLDEDADVERFYKSLYREVNKLTFS